MPLNRKRLYLLFGLLAILGIGLIVLSLDFGGAILREKAQTAVQENLNAQVDIQTVKGNPLKGYLVERVNLVRDEQVLFSAEKIILKVDLMSLFSGSPKLSLLEIRGFRSEVQRINNLINSLEMKGGGGEIPLEKVRLVDSALSSDWATAEIKELSTVFRGRNIENTIDATLDGLPVKGLISVNMEGKDLELTDFDLDVGAGNISAQGFILPELKVEGQISEIALQELVSFWPGIDPAGYEGAFSTTFTGEGTWDVPNISGELSFQGTRVSNLPLTRAEARWRYRENRLDLADLDAYVLGFPLKGNMAFVFREGPPRLLVDMEASKVDLTTLSKISPQFEQLGGMIDKVKVKLAGMVKELDGEIELQAETVRWQALSVEDSDVSLSVSKGDIQVKGKTMFNKAPVSFQGKVKSFIGAPVLDIRGTVRELDLKAMESLYPEVERFGLGGKVNGDYRATGKLPNMTLSGKVWSEALKAMKEDLLKPSSLFEYGNDRLSFSDLTLLWRGARIVGQGTVSGISTPKRAIDASFQARELDSSFFSEFYPPIREYQLDGKVTAEMGITGPLASPALQLSASSSSMKIMGDHSFSNIKVSTELPGISGEIPEVLDLAVSASGASLGGLPVSNVSLKLEKQGNRLNIAEGLAEIGKGRVSSKGGIDLPDTDTGSPVLDLVINVDRIDLNALAGDMPKPMPLYGIITGELGLKGPFSNPSMSLTAQAPSIGAAGIILSDLSVGATGNMDKIELTSLEASAGGGGLKVTGEISPRNGLADLNLTARELDLSTMTKDFSKLRDLNIQGKINGSFEGHFEEDRNRGSGALSSSLISVMGIKITDVNYPIDLDGMKILVNGARGLCYGGDVKGSGALDIQSLKFNKDLDLSGTDVNALMKDAFAIKGDITGKAQVFAKLQGSLGEQFSYTGKGLLKVGEGQISGFKGIDVLSKLHGIAGIRYSSVYAPFSLDTGVLTLQKDTRAQAFEGDPLYSYMTAQGSVGPESMLDLSCQGNVNLQLLKVLLGGAMGGLSSEKSLEGFLQGVLKGASGEMEKEDFRDISFKVGGTFQKPKLSNLKIAPAPESGSVEETPQISPDVPALPTGEDLLPETGDTVEGEAPEKDVKEQLKEEVLKKIFQ